MKNKVVPTTLLALVAITVIVACVWGLKTLYLDAEPLTLSPAKNIEEPVTASSLALPKLFIYTSELNKETPATETTSKTLSDNDMILKVIVQNKHRLQRCYENHLRNQPESRGEIHLALHMTPFGKVQNVKVEKSDFQNDPLFPSCLESVIKRLRFKFEKADKNFIVSIPLEFQ